MCRIIPIARSKKPFSDDFCAVRWWARDWWCAALQCPVNRPVVGVQETTLNRLAQRFSSQQACPISKCNPFLYFVRSVRQHETRAYACLKQEHAHITHILCVPVFGEVCVFNCSRIKKTAIAEEKNVTLKLRRAEKPMKR